MYILTIQPSVSQMACKDVSRRRRRSPNNYTHTDSLAGGCSLASHRVDPKTEGQHLQWFRLPQN